MKKAFSGWKIFTAIAIGFLISGWMLYNSISQTQFLELEKGKGTHSWVDGNNNGQVDLHDSTDFKKDKEGSYEIQTVSSVLKSIDWSGASIMWILGAILFTAGRDFFYMLRIRILTKNKLDWKASFYVIMISILPSITIIIINFSHIGIYFPVIIRI